MRCSMHRRAGRSGSAWRGPRRPRPAPRAARARPRPRRRRCASASLLRRGEDRLHEQAGVVDELRAAARGRPRGRRSAASRRRESIAALATAGAICTIRRGSKGLRDQVLGAEAQVVARRRPRPRRPTARPARARRCARTAASFIASLIVVAPHVERAAEDEREAQDVVDLVRVVGAAGGDEASGRTALRLLGQDLGLGVGEREDQRLAPPSSPPSRA